MKPGDKVRELWQARHADSKQGTADTGLPVLRCLGRTWDWVSRMH